MTVVGGLDLFPPDCVIAPDDYVASTARGRDRLRGADRRGDRRRASRCSRCRPARVGLFQERGAIVPAARGTAAMQRLASEAGATLLGSTPVTSVTDHGSHVVVEAGGTSYTCRGRGGRRRRLDQPGAGRARRGDPADGDAGAGDLLRAARPHAVHLDAAVDLDGRAELLRLPLLRRGDRQGGPGLRRSARRPRRPHHRARPGDARAAGVVHGVAAAGVGRPGALVALPVHAHPRPRLRARARARPSGRRRRARVGPRLQVRADASAGSSPTSPPPVRRPPTSSAFGFDRPGLTDPDFEPNWMV